jgi:hypothetical protein
MKSILRITKYFILVSFVLTVIVFPVNALAVGQASGGDVSVNDIEQLPTDNVSDGDEAPVPTEPSGNAETETAETETGDGELAAAESNEAESVDPEPNAIEPTEAAPEVFEPTDEEPVIISVKVPENLNFHIDPYNLAGRGQIYSDGKTIRNNGDTDICVTFTDFDVSFSNEEDFDPLTEPFDMPFDEAQRYNRKAIYITLDFGRPDMEPVVITGWNGEQPSVILSAEEVDSANSYVNLTIGGNLNPGPLNYWKNGDVSISIDYHIDVITPELPTPDPMETISAAAESPTESTQAAGEGD